MTLLYLTADEVGAETGGGKVTHHEYVALRELGTTKLLSRKELDARGGAYPEPWKWDAIANHYFLTDYKSEWPELAHVYAGTWGSTLGWLKHNGTKVCVTVAAHDRHVSRREHEALGVPFPYPHLVEEELWQRYIEGYRLADVIVCPSTVARDTVRGYGGEFRDKRIEVIPHGVDLPKCVQCDGEGQEPEGDTSNYTLRCMACGGSGVAPPKPPPPRFTVGYLGSCGAPDKGLRYLLAAWKKLGYPNAVLLLGGRDSTSPWVRHLIETYGGGNVVCTGWVKDPADFYARCSLYVQPSATEGFGIEVLESLACGVPVTVSVAAGAQDCLLGDGGEEDLRQCEVVPACDPDAIAESIEWHRRRPCPTEVREQIRDRARRYTWDKVRSQYQALWRSMIA